MASHVGQDPAGRNGIDADTVGRQLGGERPREGEERALGGGVVRVVCLAPLAGRGGDGDDDARAAGNHDPRGVVAHGVGAAKVDLQRLVPLLGGHGLDGRPLPDPVAHHHHVEGAEACHGLVDETAGLVGAGHVGAGREGLASGALHLGHRLQRRGLVADVVHGHAGAEQAEVAAYGPSDAAAAARDERRLALERQHAATLSRGATDVKRTR